LLGLVLQNQPKIDIFVRIPIKGFVIGKTIGKLGNWINYKSGNRIEKIAACYT